MTKKDKNTCQEVFTDMMTACHTLEMMQEWIISMDSPDTRLLVLLRTMSNLEKDIRDDVNFVKGLVK